jgi:hypothetical protein
MKERRRAIEAKLIEKSKSNPGYYKYKIKIKELNGEEHVVPSYGVDMEDALRRIIKNENKEKINKVYTKKIEPTLFVLIFGSWLSCILISAINYDNPKYALYGTLGVVSFMLLYSINKLIKLIKE